MSEKHHNSASESDKGRKTENSANASNNGMIMMHPDEIKAMQESLLAMQKEMSEMRMIERYRPHPMETSEFNYEAQFSVDDFMEKPVIFYSHHSLYITYGDKNANGSYIKPPFKDDQGKPEPIKFEYSFSIKRTLISGTQSSFMRFSTYTCTNKKIYAFLKAHPKFNIDFYENLNTDSNFNHMMARCKSDAATQVFSMTPDQIRTNCLNRGIQMNMNGDRMKYALIDAIAEEKYKHANQPGVIPNDPKIKISLGQNSDHIGNQVEHNKTASV